MNALTARQKELYDFIIQHLAETGSQPSQAEMMDHMSVSSQNSIVSMLALMERKGYVKRTGRSRAMKILRREH